MYLNCEEQIHICIVRLASHAKFVLLNRLKIAVLSFYAIRIIYTQYMWLAELYWHKCNSYNDALVGGTVYFIWADSIKCRVRVLQSMWMCMCMDFVALRAEG